MKQKTLQEHDTEPLSEQLARIQEQFLEHRRYLKHSGVSRAVILDVDPNSTELGRIFIEIRTPRPSDLTFLVIAAIAGAASMGLTVTGTQNPALMLFASLVGFFLTLSCLALFWREPLYRAEISAREWIEQSVSAPFVTAFDLATALARGAVTSNAQLRKALRRIPEVEKARGYSAFDRYRLEKRRSRVNP